MADDQRLDGISIAGSRGGQQLVVGRSRMRAGHLGAAG
jgi:hypothetical protein